MFCIYAMLISRTVTLHKAPGSQMNRQYLAVLEFCCNQSQYIAHPCKKQQTGTLPCFIITRCMNAFLIVIKQEKQERETPIV